MPVVNGKRITWEAWRDREAKCPDPRIQAIRCTACKRLRQLPKTDDPRTHFCGCGSSSFATAFPHPDEVELAIKLYTREIEEKGLYQNVVQEVVRYKDSE